MGYVSKRIYRFRDARERRIADVTLPYRQEIHRLAGGMRWLLIGVLLAVTAERSLSVEVTGCEWKDVEMKCPTGQQLHISSAYYGRKNNSLTCTDVDPVPPKTCWQDVTSVIKKKCTGSTGCSLDVTNELTEVDPCKGYHKYVTVDWICKTGGKQTGTGCEYDKIDIKCSSGAPTITAAHYGRKEHRVCADVEMPKRNCWFPVKDSLEELCDKATNECKVDVSNSNFWADPCWAIAKYVTINYECEASAQSLQAADLADNEKEAIIDNINKMDDKLKAMAEHPENFTKELKPFEAKDVKLTDKQKAEIEKLKKEEEAKKKKEEADNKNKDGEDKKKKEEAEKKKKEEEEKKKKEEEVAKKKKEEEEKKKKEAELKKQKEEAEKKKKEAEEKKKKEEEEKKKKEEAAKKKKEEEEKKKKEEEEAKKKKAAEDKKKKEEEEKKKKEEAEKKKKEEEEKKKKEEE